MSQFKIQKYNPSCKEKWDKFVTDSVNGTFLFHRDFMEYHSDCFEDFSLLVFDHKEKLICVLPANRVGNQIHSHQGLTYGGLVYNELKLAKIIVIFKEILFYFNSKGFEKIHIKSIPSIYHKRPAEELLYVLFLAEAKLQRRDSLAVLDLESSFKLSVDRKAGIKKGRKYNLEVKETAKFDTFWNEILIPNLEKKHNAKPVHTLKEINLLKEMFPLNIRQFNVYYEGKILAGTTIFETDTVAHSQYISANDDKNKFGSLDFLHNYLITTIFQHKKYFDFGISNESLGRKLNGGLSYWKESFGASTIVQDFYEVQTSNYNLLENVLL
ncbi:MAG: GNAT family N-acetyltransferase [Limnohabitans sp.]|nr:GNAT family N-acetyltransferase [Limnohabitans sp.]